MTDPSALAALVDRAVAATLARSPVEATYLGDHTHDSQLEDPSAEAAAARSAEIRVTLAVLGALELESADEQIDAAVLRTVLAAEVFQQEELDEATWNPMLHNPGGGLHALLSREFAPLPDRLRSVAGRLAAVPAYLDAARTRLATMSRIHLDTALAQLEGTIGLLDTELHHALDLAASAVHAEVESAAETAITALEAHRAWLTARADTAERDPRIGEQLFVAKLALTLDTAFDPQSLLARAEADLDRLGSEILEAAGRISGVSAPDRDTVRGVLDDLARDAPTDASIRGLCRDALADCTEFVRAADLVTVHDDPIEVVEMPEIDRGVAVAYCRPSGPLESAALPTEFAVSPTPAGWSEQRVRSFYREYNEHMLHNLTVHEAMPGHALQLMHANRYQGVTPVRRVWWSGSFVEGWAVYTEQLMVARGYRADAPAPAGLRMQQLKMALRSTINAILDIRFHCGDLDEAAALDLMQRRGFQEQGEAAGKWRRVQLSATQLCTYYVGFTEVRAIANDLRSARPDWTERQVHDAMLAHGSPPPRHLRTILGLTPQGPAGA